MVTSDGAVLPVVKALATFMNVKRLHGLALGLRPSRLDDAGDGCRRCGGHFELHAYDAHLAWCRPAPTATADRPEEEPHDD